MKHQVLSLAAAAAISLPISAEEFSVKTFKDSDTVTLSKTNGVTQIDFSIEPTVPRISGCFRFTGGWADLLFKAPHKLSPTDEHILFEQSMPCKCDRTKVLVMPLIRDEDGELFCFATQEMQILKAPKRPWEFSGKWTKLYTPSFYAGEAGAASQDVFTLESEGVDFTPGGQLEFLGFRLMLRQSVGDFKPDEGNRRRSGTLYIGNVEICGEKIPFSDPYAYADAFIPKKGEYNVAAQIRNEFQAPPVRELSYKLRFNPDDSESRKQKVIFPMGPDGCYWIDWQITDTNGAVVNSGDFRKEIYFNPDKTPVFPVDTTKAPVLGIMRVNPDHAGHGVYAPEERATIEVRVFSPDNDKISLSWKQLPLSFQNILDEGKIEVPVTANGKFASVQITPKKFADRPAYRLVIEAESNGEIIDRQTYFYGYKNGLPLSRHDREGALPDRREYKKHPYNRTTFTPKGGASAYITEENYLDNYRKFLEGSKEAATSFTFMQDLRDWEVLPGVFDTWLIDKIFDMAADAGMKATVRASHSDIDESNFYRWNRYERQIGADGTVLRGHAHYGAYSVPDKKNTKIWLDAYRALYDRYQHHTAFEGYYIMQPGGEWTVIDQPWNGTVSGYDPATVTDFRNWLKEKYGTATEISKAWKREIHSFTEIEPPMPKFRLGLKADFSREWIDFCQYKASLGDGWMKTSVNSIRSYDNDRLTISYCSPRSVAAILGDKLDYGHNGGNHYGKALYEYIDAWKDYKVGWISEPHHPHAWSAYGDPKSMGWVLDWTTWVMTAQAAGGGANIHVYYFPWKTMERLDFWGARQSLDRYITFKPILDELHEMEVFRPRSQVAFASDRMTLWTKHRTTFSARLIDLRLWQETLDQDVVPYGDFLPERIGEYKLVVPNLLDVALQKDTFENYVKVVKECGAKMIITANTGSYVPELFGEEPFQLLRAFGITPPAKPYCRKGTDVNATCTDNAVIFEKGRKIPFETGDRLHAQLLDENVQKNFWKFRFRWIPETDYFGYYPEVSANGQVLATFPDGGTAISMHKAGKGEVIVFWGLPDFDGENLKGMMAAAANWAGYQNPFEGCPVQHFIEGENKRLERHYLLLWKDDYGTYTVKVRNIPDGVWFADDSVSGQRIGLFDGKKLREDGLSLTWHEGYSPLKYIRFSKRNSWFEVKGDWCDKFRNESLK